MASHEDDLTTYEPSLSPPDIERIRAWHESAYESSRARGELTFEYLGLELVVPPTVQPITPTSHLLGEAVVAEVTPDDLVLDMGTGCGVNGILAARAGARVVAVDINPNAVAAARANAARNGVTDRFDVRESDVFGAVSESFDLIVFDPPFRWFKPRDLTEAAITDESYRALTAFFRQARSHLTPEGRMLVFFGTSGDLGYLKRLMEDHGFNAIAVAHLEGERDGTRVEYFTFKAT